MLIVKMKLKIVCQKIFLLTFLLCFSHLSFSKNVALSCEDKSSTSDPSDRSQYFYTMAYLAPIGFIYEDGTEVTEKNYQDGFNMTKKNGFLIMIDTESLDGFLTYDYRFMKSDGARYGYPRTQAFQKKEKVVKTSDYYYFDNSEKIGNLVDFPIIVIDREDVSKSYVVKNARGEDYGRTPCEFIDFERYKYLHRELDNIEAYTKKINESKNQF